jgi:signal transduction histidine kinase
MKPEFRTAWSLTNRLLLNTAGAMVLIVVVGVAAYASVLMWGSEYLINSVMRQNLERLSDSLRFDADGKLVAVAMPADAGAIFDALPQDAIYRVLDAGGKVLLASDHVFKPLTAPRQRFVAGQNTFTAAPSKIQLHVMTVPMRHAGRTYYLQIARSERLQGRLHADDADISWKVALVVVLLAMTAFSVVVWLTFRRSLQPLRDISRTAASIAPDNLAARLSIAGMPLELLPLLNAFNAALARLERGYQVQREFLATAAHELKTPLTLMRGQLELGDIADAAQLLQDVEQMSRQVQQLLNLAECSEPQNYHVETVDLAAAVSDVIHHLARLSTRRKVTFDVVSDKLVTLVKADRGALFVLLKNLLENAAQHSRAGAGVLVSVGSGELVVRDYGSGIAPGDLPMLFQRFWRGAQRRDEGAGLGLAICREIANAHGWTLDARNASVGAEFVLCYHRAG